MIELSIIIPAYNEAKNVTLLKNRLTIVLDKIDKKNHEIIFIDDGSKDKTYQELKELHKKDKKVKIIRFKRNFGKAAALSAGFELAKGKLILTMDADLQDDPREIPRLLNKLGKGYDLVVGWKYKRKDPYITKVIPSKIFNFLVRKLTKIKLHDSDCNFRLMKKEVLDNLAIYGGLYRYIPSLTASKGYRIGEIKVRHNPRKHGKSKFGFTRLFKGTFDLITIKYLISYSQSPLYFFGGIGLFFESIGFILGLYLLHVKLILKELIGTRPLLFLVILLIILGIQLISLGLIAEMIVHTHKKSNYLIKNTLK